LKDPKTSQGFIDRFLVTAEAYHIPAIIVFNKIEVYRKKEMDKLEELTDMYETIGYKILPMSIEKLEGIDEVSDQLKNKTTLMSGHSGVGKSTFINWLFPELSLKTQGVSDWSGKGLHTTTFAEMFDLPFGGKVIDTPGIRELGLLIFPGRNYLIIFLKCAIASRAASSITAFIWKSQLCYKRSGPGG
jgi:ribosome biogenesis GTPase